MVAGRALADLCCSREQGRGSRRLEYLSSALSSLYLRGDKQTELPFAGRSEDVKSKLRNAYSQYLFRPTAPKLDPVIASSGPHPARHCAPSFLLSVTGAEDSQDQASDLGRMWLFNRMSPM